MSRGLAFVLVFVAAAAGCSSTDNTANSEAMEAYLGLDSSVEKALDLAFVGINNAVTENIGPGTLGGDAKGTLVVAGQIDQGTGLTKTVRVDASYNGYSDDGAAIYTTDPASPPLLTLEVSYQDGSLTGRYLGQFTMSGALAGPLTLDIAINGYVQSAGKTGGIERAPYSTQIHGTAVSDYGSYLVDFTR
jgi:hypothetical protein